MTGPTSEEIEAMNARYADHWPEILDIMTHARDEVIYITGLPNIYVESGIECIRTSHRGREYVRH